VDRINNKGVSNVNFLFSNFDYIQFQLEFVLVPCGKWFLNYVGLYKEIYITNLTIHQCHWIGEMKLEGQPSAVTRKRKSNSISINYIYLMLLEL
jgi:hypothetical protein